MKDVKQGTEGTKEERLGVSVGEGSQVPEVYGHLLDTPVTSSNTGLVHTGRSHLLPVWFGLYDLRPLRAVLNPEAGGRPAAGVSAHAPVVRAISSASCAAGRCCPLDLTAPCTVTSVKPRRLSGRRNARHAATQPADHSGRCLSGQR